MGFGLPSAIGAKVAAPEKIVVDIDGDASFSMTAMELATASQFNIGVKVLVLNNEFQGMVLQWQGMSNVSFPSYFQNHHGFVDLFYDGRYSHTAMTNPDFVALAKSMRVHAIRCDSSADLPAKMKEFLEYDNSKPVLMEVVVEKNEHVFPMVSLTLQSSLDSTQICTGTRRQGASRTTAASQTAHETIIDVPPSLSHLSVDAVLAISLDFIRKLSPRW
jgi:acetolactate synthase-1/2/3 large subunit